MGCQHHLSSCEVEILSALQSDLLAATKFIVDLSIKRFSERWERMLKNKMVFCHELTLDDAFLSKWTIKTPAADMSRWADECNLFTGPIAMATHFLNSSEMRVQVSEFSSVLSRVT